MTDMVVSNSTPLILLDKINYLNLLESLYKQVYVPEAVYTEITQTKYLNSIFSSPYIHVVRIENLISKKMFANQLHSGEVEVFILANEINAKLCLIDDLLARKYAANFGLNVTGTVGILLDAKERKYIGKIKPLLDSLIANKMRISTVVYRQALLLANEISE